MQLILNNANPPQMQLQINQWSTIMASFFGHSANLIANRSFSCSLLIKPSLCPLFACNRTAAGYMHFNLRPNGVAQRYSHKILNYVNTMSKLLNCTYWLFICRASSVIWSLIWLKAKWFVNCSIYFHSINFKRQGWSRKIVFKLLPYFMIHCEYCV